MIREYIGEPAMWEQLAEEASELSQAALKMARIIRGENPTPVTREQALVNAREEFTDVMLCGMELEIQADPTMIYQKQKRFTERAIQAETDRAAKVTRQYSKPRVLSAGEIVEKIRKEKETNGSDKANK